MAKFFKWIVHIWRISKWARFGVYVALFVLAVIGFGPWAARMSWLTGIEEWIEARAAHPIMAAFILGLFFSTWLLPVGWKLVRWHFFLPKQQMRDFYVQSAQLIERIHFLYVENASTTREITDFESTVANWLEKHRGPAARSKYMDLGPDGNPASSAFWNLKVRHQNLAHLIEKDGGW